MLFVDGVYMGLQPAHGQRPSFLVGLDEEKRPVLSEKGDMEKILAIIAGAKPRAIAITTPQNADLGLMRRPEIRRRFNLRPGGSNWMKWRVCEYELRRRNIRITSAPARSVDAPAWMRAGFVYYQRLKRMGYQMYSSDMETQEKILLETSPHACYSTLLKIRPFRKDTLEGRLQRQLVLYMEGLDVLNPMRVMEEITRHRLLTGNLGLDKLYAADELDALVAAYCAQLTVVQSQRICQVGEREDGLITLPAGELAEFYS